MGLIINKKNIRPTQSIAPGNTNPRIPMLADTGAKPHSSHRL